LPFKNRILTVTPAQYYHTLNLGGELTYLNRPWIMGILNATPDSFFSTSRVDNVEALLEKAGAMLEQGATLVDIGGQSTRPGAVPVNEEEELERVIPAVAALKKHFPGTAISVDTFFSRVAREAVKQGACIVNDVSAGSADPAMFETVASLRVPYVLMHNPGTLHGKTIEGDVVVSVVKKLSSHIDELNRLGVNDIIIDPGFGFGKTLEQNYALLAGLKHLSILKKPVLAGLSRKSMIWKPIGGSPETALNGTTALHMLALSNGAAILRVHDVKEAAEVVNLFSLYSGMA
jgi:dihydropteroate synthase